MRGFSYSRMEKNIKEMRASMVDDQCTVNVHTKAALPTGMYEKEVYVKCILMIIKLMYILCYGRSSSEIIEQPSSRIMPKPMAQRSEEAKWLSAMPRNCNAFGCHVVIIDFC